MKKRNVENLIEKSKALGLMGLNFIHYFNCNKISDSEHFKNQLKK